MTPSLHKRTLGRTCDVWWGTCRGFKHLQIDSTNERHALIQTQTHDVVLPDQYTHPNACTHAHTVLPGEGGGGSACGPGGCSQGTHQRGVHNGPGQCAFCGPGSAFNSSSGRIHQIQNPDLTWRCTEHLFLSGCCQRQGMAPLPCGSYPNTVD